MTVIISSILLIMLLGCLIFANINIFLGVIGIIAAAAVIILSVFMKSKLKKPLFGLLTATLLCVTAVMGVLAVPNSGGEGTLAHRDSMLEEISTAKSENIKALSEKYTELYGEDDTLKLTLAERYIAEDDSNAARDTLRYINDKTSKEYYMQQSEWYRRFDRFQYTRELWNDAVENHPDWDTAYLMLALSMMEDQSQRLPEIEYYLMKAFVLNPNSPYTVCYLGVVKYQSLDYIEAMRYFATASKLNGGLYPEIDETINTYIELIGKEIETE